MPSDGRPVDAVVLGLAEFGVRECREFGSGIELTVETTADVVGCHGCGVRAHSKGRSSVLGRDIDAFDRPVRLRWVKRRWHCPEPVCAVKTWTEQTAAVAPRRQLARACSRAGVPAGGPRRGVGRVGRAGLRGRLAG